jgi:hypothetical protein
MISRPEVKAAAGNQYSNCSAAMTQTAIPITMMRIIENIGPVRDPAAPCLWQVRLASRHLISLSVQNLSFASKGLLQALRHEGRENGPAAFGRVFAQRLRRQQRSRSHHLRRFSGNPIPVNGLDHKRANNVRLEKRQRSKSTAPGPARGEKQNRWLRHKGGAAYAQGGTKRLPFFCGTIRIDGDNQALRMH